MPEDIHARPIGIFDSGVGGLTLFKSIRNLLPNERLLYFGDTARLPYGTKSPNAVRRFSLQIARFLERFRIKALVVACHTASSTALVDLKIAMKIPVVGVIEPTVKKAIQVTRNKNIGVIGTKTTIASNSFQSHLKKASPSVFVTAIPAPLLVPLVEEGWVDRELTRMILKEYLSIFKKREIDTLILGCTHYPLLKTLFQEELSDSVHLVEPSIETASYLRELLRRNSLLNREKENHESRFYVTDDPDNFSQLARLFLGQKLKEPVLVHLEGEEQ